MTDTPSERPDETAAPESATPQEAPAPPKRSYARVTDPGPRDAGAPGAGAPGWRSTPGWGQVPPAPAPGWVWAGSWVPQPGIIPLRPLGVGEIISGAFALVRRYWQVVLIISASVSLVSQIAITAATDPLGPSSGSIDVTVPAAGDSTALLHQELSTMAQVAPPLAVIGLIGLLTGVCASALLTIVVSRAVLGKPASLGDAWTEARPRLLQLLGVAVTTTALAAAIVAASVAPAMIASASGSSDTAVSELSMLVVPGLAIALWTYVTLSLAAPALILERQGIRRALSRSARLVRGAWWRIFGITLLVGILALLATLLISIPFSMVALIASGTNAMYGSGTSLSALAVESIGGWVAATLTAPVTAAVPVLLYIDQRIRREALDIELAAAAGVPNYGAPALV